MVKIKHANDTIDRFLKELMSRPSERGPSIKADVRIAYDDLYQVIPSYGSPVTSLDTPNALEISTNRDVMTIVHAKQVAYI